MIRIRAHVSTPIRRSTTLWIAWSTLLSAVSIVSFATAQESKTAESSTQNKAALLAAARMIDSDRLDQLDDARKVFELELSENPRSIVANAGLVFVCYSMRDMPATARAIERLSSSRIELPRQLRSGVGKVELCLAIADGDAVRAERLLKGLVKAALRDDLPGSEQHSYRILIGSIVGLLKQQSSPSPISGDILERTDLLLSSKGGPSLSGSFKSAREKGEKYAGELRRWLDDWADKSPDERRAALEASQRSIEKEEEELGENADSYKDSRADHKDALRQGFLGSRKLGVELEQVIIEQNTPTVGHPGVRPSPPQVPDRNRVEVDEYRTETKYNKDGTRTEEKVRRDRSEVEREKDEKYQRWLTKYEYDQRVYNEAITVYTRALAVWEERDRVRREELAKSRATLESKLQRIFAESKEHQEKQKQEAADVKAQRDALKVRKREVQVASLAAKALDANNNDLAFRDACFDVGELTWEKLQLLQVLQGTRSKN